MSIIDSYTYKGRHRAPTETVTGKRVAALMTVATAGFVPFAGQAAADPPGGWGPIIQCESGGNIRAQNPTSTASGAYQIINGTWRGNGGLQFAPTAKQATFEQQTIVANRIFERRGSLADWDASRSCWQGKTGPVRITGRTAPQAVKKAREAAGQNLAPARRTGQYVVKSGDTLSGIAGSNWREVFEANRNVIGSNPNLIFPGQVLSL